MVQRSRERIVKVMGVAGPDRQVMVTTANWLTIARFVIVPFFWWLFFQPSLLWRITATLLFIIGALSDLWDGKLARRRGEVTPFGDFMDPLADKLMVLSAYWAILIREDFGAFTYLTLLWTIIITLREAGITLLRVWAIGAGGSVVTSIWGKLKTAVQLVTLILTLTLLNLKTGLIRAGEDPMLLGTSAFPMFICALYFLCAVFSTVSGWLYLRKPSAKQAV